MYLMIENPGICPVEGFTILGLSTARDDNGAIGQFGSGNKHGVLTLLRMGLQPTIFLGAKKLEFTTKLKNMAGKSYQQVYYKLNGTTYPLNMSLGYGELDWTDVDMALREFVSNALDQVGGKTNRLTIEFVDEVKHKTGATRVFIPDHEQVRSFFHSIAERFLHFTRDVNQTILDKNNSTPAKIYRKGVFVRSFPNYTKSLYDYNFTDELRIDEARNLSDYSCYDAMTKAMTANVSTLAKTLDKVHRNPSTNYVENRISSYHFSSNCPLTNEQISTTFQKVFGKLAVVANENHGPLLQQAMNKGFRPILMADGWYKFISNSGVETTLDVIDDINDQGHKLLPACPETQTTAKEVWAMLKEMHLTKSKLMPKVVNFQTIMDGGSEIHGYYKDGVIHISLDHKNSRNVMLEEMAHYITGANDNTRDFQDFAFRGWAKLMDMVW